MKESKIKSNFEQDVLRPTLCEFLNFKKYLNTLEKDDFSFVLVDPPAEWSANTKRMPDSEILQTCVTQSVLKLPSQCYDLLIKETRVMTLNEFKAKFSEAKTAKGKTTTEKGIENIDELEDMFWRQVCKKKIYAINIPTSLFGDDTKVWNLDKFTKDESNIHSKPDHRFLERQRKVYAMQGIQTPVLYIGARFTSFPWHIEDGNLCSINYLHEGQPKFWYMIHKEDSSKFEDLAHKIVENKRECDLYIRHKTLLIPPSVIKKNGIRFTRVVQKPGQFVITFPNVYHSGFNLGFNTAESINFGTENWLQMFEKFETCKCEFSATVDAPNQAVEGLRIIFEQLQTKFTCTKCHKEFVSEKTLTEHKSKQHKKQQEIFQCTTCHVTCTTPYTLITHVKTEHKKRIKISTAKACGSLVTVSTKVSVVHKKKIAKNKHKKECSQFICKVCGKVFSRRFNLQRHERDYNHIPSETMLNSIENVSEIKQPILNLDVSTENRNVSAPNIAISQGIVESNCDNKMQTRTAKSKKRKAEQVDNGYNLSEPGPSKVDKETCKPTRKNVKTIKEEVIEGKGCRGGKKPVTSKEPTGNAQDRKRAAHAASSPAEKMPAKKDKKEATATSASKAKSNGTPNTKLKAGVKAAPESTTDELDSGLIIKRPKGTAKDCTDAERDILPSGLDLSQNDFDIDEEVTLKIAPVNVVSLQAMVAENLEVDVHEAPVEPNGNVDSMIGNGHSTNGTAPYGAENRGVEGKQKKLPAKEIVKTEPIQIIPALPLKTMLPRIKKISRQNIAGDHSANHSLTPNFERLKMKDLLTREIPDDICSIEFDNNTKKLDYLKSVVQKARTEENSYIEAFTAMVQLEEAAHSKFLKKFDIENVRLHLYARENQIFQIQINANQQIFQKACRESLLDGFTVKQLISGQNVGAGEVVGCRGDSVFIHISQGFEELSDCYAEDNQLFTLNFFTNRSVYKVLLNTLEWFKKHKLHTVLVNNELYDQVDYQKPIKRNEQKNFKCSISEVLNEEQKSAVQQIVWGENDKVPILLHGPPGTGKTLTLVAAIAEIVQGTTDHVLVLAQSNAACDELTIRLTEVLRHGELYRLYAKSFKKETLCDKIKPICNIMSGEFQLPALKHLYRFRVVVSTLSTSGCLVRARGEDQEFDSSHFKRIIIDEAGCTHEPSTMIPIAGLCSENGVVNARIVLSGDPKQLDAVTKSKNAIKLGFKTSWMEYLMTNKTCYTRHPILKLHDPRFITVLKKNYRSHPDILAIPNKLFYDGVLEAKVNIDETRGIIANQLLPNSSFPLVFESVNGECEQEFGDTSYFNQKEVHMVIEWIQKLSKTEWKEKKISPSNIGIVSPYKKQCELIRNELSNNGFGDVTVGTAEVYQGKEKQIIIISTVRTGNPLGFISNEQRINVMITRAIGLLIIVGNHEALECDPNWAALIDHCNKNGALIRQERKLHLRIKAPE